jgi:serine/threonine-protein kinase RsbT
MERFIINKGSDIGIAVVGVQARARALGFTESQIHRLGTAVSELAHNIVKYAAPNGGDIMLQQDNQDNRKRLLVQARDNGPGIADLEQALSDHFSSAGTLGLGLPGVKRIVDEFSIVSEAGSGTVVSISIVGP